MEMYIFVEDLYEECYGTDLYITYATFDEKKMKEYVTKNMSQYDKKQIELGYKKLSDCYLKIKSGKQKIHIGGYIE